MLTLYRGITVPTNEADNIIADFLLNGIGISDNAKFHFEIDHINHMIPDLIKMENLSKKNTQANSQNSIEKLKCLCFADELGAQYYALKHNLPKLNTTPILIKIIYEEEKVYVDGRDFLFYSFSRTSRQEDSELRDKRKELLLSIYGLGLNKYFEKVKKIENIDHGALCDLIYHDIEIVKEHYKNKLLIEGRYGTTFKSAFFVSAPIPKENIVSIVKLTEAWNFPTPALKIHDFQ